MNIVLINSFREFCEGRLAELINSCYLSIEKKDKIGDKYNDSILICKIYTPRNIEKELIVYQEDLIYIGEILNIQYIYVFPLKAKNLLHFKRQAITNNDLESWKKYLEIQYLF